MERTELGNKSVNWHCSYCNYLHIADILTYEPYRRYDDIRVKCCVCKRDAILPHLEKDKSWSFAVEP